MFSFDSFYRSNPPALLGVDVSSSSIKLVELRRDRTLRWTLLHCAAQALDPSWIKDGQLDKFDEVAEALRLLVRASGSKTRQVAMALPASAVITKKINIPEDLSGDELELRVESEAAQYLPFPLADVSLDFSVLGPASNASGLLEVLLVATRKEKVQDRLGLADAAGLVASVMDVESFASRLAVSHTLAALPDQGRNQLLALFEIGSRHTSLQVLRNDEVVYERDQVFGGAQLTTMIARQYGYAFEEAESKKKSGKLPPDYTSLVLAPYLEQLAQDIGRALQFFFTSTPHNRVDCILLSGGGAAVPGLDTAVMNLTSYPARVINPFETMAPAPDLLRRASPMHGHSFLVATGLAMRRYYPCS